MKSEFRGKVFEYVGLRIVTILLSIVTLGIAAPWIICMFENWIAENSVSAGNRFSFDGKGSSLVLRWLKWLLLLILTLGFYAFWLEIDYQQWRLEHTHIIEDENVAHEKNVKVF